MTKIAEKIKKRNKMSKYLEDILINEAIFSYLKKRLNFFSNENAIEEKWRKYSTHITRRWLNYLDNDQFEKLFSKKIEKNNLTENANSKKNYY